MLKKWNEMPEYMKNNTVKRYYTLLVRKQSSMCLKRMVDVVLALVLTTVLAPLMLIIAVLVKLDSRGPVFYRQERITRYGQPYRIFKFRTMTADADKKGPSITKNDDSRITKIGKRLRKLRLDEVPQLLNILAGEMSFVGTRPEVKKYVQQYSEEMMATLLLPAGITSKTSIVYKDEDVMMEYYIKRYGKTVDETYVDYILPEKMKYNLQYIKNFSVEGDLKIMMETAIAVLK